MSLTHLVKVHLRPGVQSISVQYQVSNSGIWITWSDGQRIIQGATVRFTVTTYPNFTLTEWKAYYADEYDDTVNLPLSPITGQSAWEFTMPPAGPVEIRCEAEGTDSSDFGYFFRENIQPGYVLDVSEIVGVRDAIVQCLYIKGLTMDSSMIDSLVSNLSNIYSGTIGNFVLGHSRQSSYAMLFGFQTYTSVPGTIGTHSVDEAIYEGTWYDIRYSLPYSGSTITSYHYLSTETVRSGTFGYVGLTNLSNSEMQNAVVVTPYKGVAKSQDDLTSIRYIISPENSGEVDADAPVEFTQGTTEFTFKWRIKVGCSLRRITPFAVGDGSVEDDVLYSSTYDGETRTYTVTVQQIPNWAVGIRVLIECINQNDPNVGGDSKPGGGNGTFDETSDHIPIEPMPSISAADAGMITLFRPSLAELKQLGAYLWTNIEDFIDNLKKMFSNPMDTIIALNILPGLPPVGTARNIRLGIWETNVSMSPVLSQWYELNFGTVRIDEFWGSALDYSPNTKIHAMLPFIGSVQLDTDDVMGREVGLIYRIDLLSGHLVAQITVNDEVLYQFTGECAVAVPLTGADWSRVYGAIAGTLGAAAVGVAGTVAAGASAGVASNVARMGALRTAVAAGKEFRRSGIDAKGVAGVRTMRQQMLDTAQQALDASADIARGSGDASIALKAGVAAHAANNVVGQIMSGKVSVAHSGTISGSAGLLGLRRPYIYIEYPNQSLPDGYKHFYGYPSNMRAVLGELNGFTQCYQVLINGFTGTDGEFGELLEALKEGVYL